MKAIIVTQLTKVLKEHEKLRFEKNLDGDLHQVGIEFKVQMKVGAKLAMLKDKVEKLEEGTEPMLYWSTSIYEIDQVRYFKR